MTGTAHRRRYAPAVADNLPAGERPMIAVVHALPGHEEKLARAVRILARSVRREDGCRAFRAFRDLGSPGTFHLLEIYDDTDAFRAHLTTRHVEQFFAQLAAHSTSDASALTQLVELDPAPPV